MNMKRIYFGSDVRDLPANKALIASKGHLGSPVVDMEDHYGDLATSDWLVDV
jgi:hypothetical protein